MMYSTTWMNHENMLSEKKLAGKEHIFYDYVYTKGSKQTNLYREKTDWQLPGVRGVEGNLHISTNVPGIYGTMKMF